MKIKLAKGSQPPPNEPVIVVLDGLIQTPETDYALEEGGLPEFRFPALSPQKDCKPAVLMLIPRMTHVIPTGHFVYAPVSYKIRWDDDEMTGMTAYDNSRA